MNETIRASSDDLIPRNGTACSGVSVKTADLEQLAHLAQRGSAGAFDELASRFRPRLLVALCKRFGGRQEDAEDVVQESLTKAWRNIERFDTSQSFTAWLYTIAFRLAADYDRRQQRQRRNAQLVSPQTPNVAGTDGSIDDQEIAENLWATAKRVLPTSQYTILWLRYAEDLSILEIARIMKKTRVGIRVMLHRARGNLQPHVTQFIDSRKAGGQS